MADTSKSTAAKSTRSRGPRGAGRTRLIVAGIVGGLIVAFAFLNLESVEVNWILGKWQTPLIVVIVLTLTVGLLLGVFLRAASSLRRSSQPPREPARTGEVGED